MQLENNLKYLINKNLKYIITDWTIISVESIYCKLIDIYY